MKVQNISNQQNFNGAVHNKLFTTVHNAKINKALKAVQIEDKNYDLFFTHIGENIGITAQAAKDINSEITPKITTVVKGTQTSFEKAVKTTMQTYEDIVNETNKAKQAQIFWASRRNY